MSQSVDAKLQELLELAEKHGVTEVSWKEGNTKIAFRRGAAPVAAAAPAPAEAAADAKPADPFVIIKSPMVGTFRRSQTKGRPPLVMVGNHIKPGETLGVVESMKIPTDVVSYCAGEIKEVLVEDGHPVEYGQPLFLVLPSGPVEG